MAWLGFCPVPPLLGDPTLRHQHPSVSGLRWRGCGATWSARRLGGVDTQQCCCLLPPREREKEDVRECGARGHPRLQPIAS